MTKKNYTRKLVMSSIIAALIFVFTAIVHIPVSSQGAYVNIGDSVIYAASVMVGAPWAAAAAGIGSMFADILLGGGIYIPATLVIKGLMGFVCALLMHRKKAFMMDTHETRQTGDSENILTKAKFFVKRYNALVMYVMVCILGGAIMVVGYGAFEYIFMGGWSYVVATIIPNLIQWAAGVVGGIVLYYPVTRIKELIR